MTEALISIKNNQIPRTIHLKDYQVPAYLIDEIDLTIDLNEDETRVTSYMRIRHNRHSAENIKELRLNGEELILESIKLDGKILPPSHYDKTDQYLVIHNVPDNFELEVVTIIAPQKNTALSGLYRSGQTYCTQCEAEGFRRITYFLDHPDILSRYTTTISADATKYPILLSNGNLIGSGTLESGRHWAKWEDPFNKPCYLFALVAGDFDMIEDHFTTQSNHNVTLRIYVDKGNSDQAYHAMYSVKEAMRWDEKTYGREYDLDIYMIVAISDFNMGAMENKGLNIFNTKYVLAKPQTATDDDYIHILSVVGHEYFHNWTGNRVTCRDWFQLSLKEGLTIFRDQTFSEDTLSPAVMRIRDVNRLREVQFSEDAGPLSHPVRPDSYIEINNFYTATIYEKGAEVLRMLRTILGHTLFRKGMDLYFARHDGQAVTIEDYVKTMEDVSGIDLTQFRLWYSQAGTPIVTVKSNYDEEKKIYTLQISQQTLPTPGQGEKRPLHIPIKLGLLNADGKELSLHLEDDSIVSETVLSLTEATQVFKFKNIPDYPLPSLLRNFSAPIKLNYAYTENDLIFLYKYDKDAFNRWEAGQKYILNVLLSLIRDYQQDKPLQLSCHLADMMMFILQHDIHDKFLLAEMLLLPSEKYIAEHMEVADIEAIHVTREFVLIEIAKHLEELFLEIYERYHDTSGEYIFGMEAIGSRQLKNVCLSYLMLLPAHAEMGMKQFQASLHSNMTDTQAALVSLSNIDSPLRNQALDQFYTKWKNEALVVDKWFAVQAASKLPGTFQQVKKLMQHEAFDIKNPNKVYALIGTFGHRSPIHFHASNGEGYAFLRDCVQQLDKLNPQVAARMVNPLTTWKRYDKERQQLMRQQLELLLDKKLSTDLYELVTKSLE
jgi:aminopeptidase N